MASKLDYAPSSPLCDRDHGEQHSPIQLPPLHAAPHEPIVTHRRSQRIQARNAKKTPFAPSTPKHHKICRDINVNRRSRRPSSPPLPQSSPYRGVFESSPYIFDDNLVLPIIDTRNIFVQPMRLSLIMLSLTTVGSLLICLIHRDHLYDYYPSLPTSIIPSVFSVYSSATRNSSCWRGGRISTPNTGC